MPKQTNKRKQNDLTVICYYNANGIRPKKLEFAHFLKVHKVEVALLQETFLYPETRITFQGYHMYRNHRQGAAGGGTAILVRNGLSHYEIPIPPLETAEATAICLDTKIGPLTLVSVYNQPQHTIKSNDLDILLNLGSKVIAAGDWNSKSPTWNSNVTNKNGEILLKYLADTDNDIAIIGPEQPTHHPFAHPGNPGDVLDIAVLKDIRSPIKLTTIPAINSDHDPVILELGTDATHRAPPPRIKLDRIQWPIYKQQLNQMVKPNPKIKTAKDIDIAIHTLSTLLISAAEASYVPAPAKRPPPGALPENITTAISDKNRSRSLWQRTRDPQHRANYNRKTNIVKNMLKEHASTQWDKKLTDMNAKDCSLWQMTRALTKQKLKTPPLLGPNGVAASDAQKAELLAESIENQLKPNPAPPNHIFKHHVTAEVQSLLMTPVDDTPKLTSPTELTKFIKRLPSHKAPGHDDIQYELLKQLPRNSIIHLTQIFNRILILQYYPAKWKHSKLLTIPKPGKDHTQPSNYRPISLLPTISKLFEKLLHNRIQDHVAEHKILPDAQFGFRRRHATTHQLMRVVEKITEGYNKHRGTGIVFLDVAQAFDRVWHEGLIYKLRTLKFKACYIHLIASYLTDRTFSVQLNSAMSNPRPAAAGVPQGSIIGPLLFNIYTSDLPTTDSTELAIFADDTAIIADSWRPELVTAKLQEALDELELWYTKWRIKINVSKTNAVLYARRRTRPHGTLQLFGDDIEWTKSAKYLGVILDSKLTFKQHIQEVKSKGNQRLGMLQCILHRNSALSTKNALTIYKTIIRPVITYAAPTWGYVKPYMLQPLQVLQNRALSQALRRDRCSSIQQLHRDSAVPMYRDYIKTVAEKFYNSLPEAEVNKLIHEIGQYDGDPDFLQYRRPKSLTH